MRFSLFERFVVAQRGLVAAKAEQAIPIAWVFTAIAQCGIRFRNDNVALTSAIAKTRLQNDTIRGNMAIRQVNNLARNPPVVG